MIRTQAECKYCTSKEFNEPIYSDGKDLKMQIIYYNGGWKIKYSYANGNIIYTDIRYCPKCGRNLYPSTYIY